jgi:hypothetical protein
MERALLTALADPASKLVEAHEVGARIERAAGLVREAEEELDTFPAAQLAWVLGPERYRAQVEHRQDQVREAQMELSKALQANAVFVRAGGLRTPEQLVTDWPTMTMGQKRAVVRAYIKRVTLAKADPKRRRWQPIGERVQIAWMSPARSAEA